MAITFEDEEKRLPVGAVLGVILLLAAFGGGAFFGVRYLIGRQQMITPAGSSVIGLNKAVLSDSRLNSLDLLPEIVLGEETIGRDNPFLPLSAQAKAARMKGGASANNSSGTPDQEPVVSGNLPQDITKTSGAQ